MIKIKNTYKSVTAIFIVFIISLALLLGGCANKNNSLQLFQLTGANIEHPEIALNQFEYLDLYIYDNSTYKFEYKYSSKAVSVGDEDILEKSFSKEGKYTIANGIMLFNDELIVGSINMNVNRANNISIVIEEVSTNILFINKETRKIIRQYVAWDLIEHKYIDNEDWKRMSLSVYNDDTYTFEYELQPDTKIQINDVAPNDPAAKFAKLFFSETRLCTVENNQIEFDDSIILGVVNMDSAYLIDELSIIIENTPAKILFNTNFHD